MTPVRVIGIASPYGDDRIGWDALDALKESGLLERFPQGRVTLHYCGLPVSLLALLADGGSAIVIDAMRSGTLPGTVKKIALSEMQPDAGALSSHGFGVAESLALARALGTLPAATILYGIEMEQCDTSQGVSAPVKQAIPGLVRKLAGELERLVRLSGTIA